MKRLATILLTTLLSSRAIVANSNLSIEIKGIENVNSIKILPHHKLWVGSDTLTLRGDLKTQKKEGGYIWFLGAGCTAPKNQTITCKKLTQQEK